MRIGESNSFLLSPVEGRLVSVPLIDLHHTLKHPFLRGIAIPIAAVFRGMVPVRTSSPQLSIEGADLAQIDWVGVAGGEIVKVEFDVNSDGVAVRLLRGDAVLYRTNRVGAGSICYGPLDRYLRTGDLLGLFRLGAS